MLIATYFILRSNRVLFQVIKLVSKQNINHNDFRKISTQVKLINDDSIKNINRLKLYRVKL